MSDLNIQQRNDLFEKIKNCLSSLELDTTIEPMDRTEIIFDVLEQIIARCISSSATNRDNLIQIVEESSSNIKKIAQNFFTRGK